MKMRFLRVAMLLVIAFSTVLFLASLSGGDAGGSKIKPLDDFERYPPTATKFWVQLLQNPTANGEKIILRVKYECDMELPTAIKIYNGTNGELTLYDDGKAPDIKANDKIYATLMQQEPGEFIDFMKKNYEKIKQKKFLLQFSGHDGKQIQTGEIKPFPTDAFWQFSEVEVDMLLLDPVDCENEILKENSLMITDLAVVEDPLRTYNLVTHAGDPNGAWTFGTLMANMENGMHPQGLSGFLKDWVYNWTVNISASTGDVNGRWFVFETFLSKWLQTPVDASNWEAQWDGTDVNFLRENAPFKLTAIVNRMDLRGSSAYSGGMNSTGETRFIFTLIDPATGEVPMNPNQTASMEVQGGFVDWRGLNVIFEFGNVQTNKCDLQLLAQQWYDLSDLTLGSAAYNDALQLITDQVTLANAVPTKPNGSAINRVRTNEKLFAPFDNNQYVLPVSDFSNGTHHHWEQQDWEFRQFELNSGTHHLELVPLTNNPPFHANHAPNIVENYTGGVWPVQNVSILDWIYSGHRLQVKHGNFNLPSTLLSYNGRVRREETQYFNFESDEFISHGGYTPGDLPLEAKQIRHQISLNTCAGCHAGDTKTVFTHVNPLAYGESNNYWGNIPDGATNTIQDDALYPNGSNDPLQLQGHNAGHTYAPNGNQANFHVSGDIHNRNHFQGVSPFLTGRRYSDFAGSIHWMDDADETGNVDANAQDMTGLFYVNDPSNDDFGLDGVSFQDDTRWGFNDLERRKIDMCSFLNSDCHGLLTASMVKTMNIIKFVPFPEGAH